MSDAPLTFTYEVPSRLHRMKVGVLDDATVERFRHEAAQAGERKFYCLRNVCIVVATLLIASIVVPVTRFDSMAWFIVQAITVAVAALVALWLTWIGFAGKFTHEWPLVSYRHHRGRRPRDIHELATRLIRNFTQATVCVERHGAGCFLVVYDRHTTYRYYVAAWVSKNVVAIGDQVPSR
jgi:hypothetical protein